LKIPYLSIKQRFLLLVTAALLFGLTPAIHAEGLSGLKDSLNKGKINKADVLNAPNSQPDIIKETPAISVPAKTKRIADTDTSKAKPKFVFVDKKRSESKVKSPKNKKDAAKEFNEELKKNYNKVRVALKQAKKKKKAAPRIAAVRIGDDPETDDSIPAKLPEDFLINIDTDELAIRKEVKTLYDSFESLSLDDFNKACDKLYGKYYKTRPDICHLIKLIKADAKLKKDQNYALEDQMLRMLRWPSSFETVPYPTFQTSMHEEYLKMSRDTEAGNDLLKFVNKKAKKRQEQIKKANDDFLIVIRNEINVLNKLKADYEKYVKDLLSLTHILPGYTVTYENNPEYLQRVMKYAIDDIKTHYQKISQKYLIIAIYLNSAGQWDESLQLAKEFKEYFEKNCPYKFTIKYAGKIDYDEAVSSGNLGNLKILRGDLLIDKDNLKWGPKRIDQAALECMSRLSLQNITDQVNNLEFHKKIIEFAETNIADQEEIKQYKKETKVKEIRFETNEFSGTSNSSRVFAANDRICIKCYYEPGYNQYYQPPIVITLNSTVSNRYKYVTVIGGRGEYAPYAIFKPNETNDPKDSVENLINNENDAQKESIACSRCEINLQSPLLLYQNHLFGTRLGRTDFDIEQVKKGYADYLNSFSFFKSGGAEKVSATLSSSDVNGEILLRNQADWLVLQGHGTLLTGCFGELVKANNNPIIITPASHTTEKFIVKNENGEKFTREVEVCPLIKPNGESEFSEDLNVLVLAGCDSLGTPRGICAWHKTLAVTGEDKIILGYKGKVSNYVIVQILTQLNKILKENPKITKKEIGFYWEKLNYDYNNTCWNPISASMNGAYHMAYIYSDTYYYCLSSKIMGPLSAFGYNLSPASDTDLYLIEEFDPKSEEPIQ